jgi:hypothetical protein
VLPCWLVDLLLFLRGLLYGLLGRLLRGCLLGCFLGCHLPILPFRWVASNLQLFIAVEKCIDSRSIDVKKKTQQEWKKRQQLFRCGIAREAKKRCVKQNVGASDRDS